MTSGQHRNGLTDIPVTLVEVWQQDCQYTKKERYCYRTLIYSIYLCSKLYMVTITINVELLVLKIDVKVDTLSTHCLSVFCITVSIYHHYKTLLYYIVRIICKQVSNIKCKVKPDFGHTGIFLPDINIKMYVQLSNMFSVYLLERFE